MTHSLRTLEWNEITLGGAVEVQLTEAGLRPRRLPAKVCLQLDDPLLTVTTAMAAGIRICLQSDATVLEVEASLTGLRYAGGRARPVTFDLLVDGQLVEHRKVASGAEYYVDFATVPPTVEQFTAAPQRIRFGPLPAGIKRLELWLPHNAEIELRAVRVDAQAHVRPLVSDGPKWVHHGSSISHGKEVSGPTGSWPALVAAQLGLNLTTMGFSGQCMLDGSVARSIGKLDADIISLKLGANVVAADTMRERTFRSAVHTFLDIVRDQHPTIPVLVISPIVAPAIERHPGPMLRTPHGFETVERCDALLTGALTMERVRSILAQCVELRRSHGDTSLRYLDGQQLLGTADAARLVDGLHPDAIGHQLMADRMAPVLQGLGAAQEPATCSR